MYLAKKVFLRAFLTVILCFSVITFSGIITETTAEAAVKAVPSLKENKTILYAGYKSYAIKPKNILKNAVITYKSSDKKVASVSTKGVIEPISQGEATVTVTIKQNQKTYNLKMAVTVKEPYIEFTQTADYLNVGEYEVFKAKAYGTDDKILWSISDMDIATINNSGRVSAVAGGTVNIFADAGDVSAKYELYIGTNRIGTFSKNITIYDDYTVWISVPDIADGENIVWETLGEGIITCTWGQYFVDGKNSLIIEPLAAGTETLVVYSDKSTDRLYINVTVIDKPTDRIRLTAEEVYTKCSPCTVEISATDEYGEAVLGSGVFVSDGMIVTNYHVIKGASKIVVRSNNEKEYPISTIISYNEKLDLAILGTQMKNDSLVISMDPVSGGQSIYTIGSPLGLTDTFSDGMVSNASRIIEDVDYIQIDAPISPGNSGGPLVNAYGEVIGINTMYYVDGQNLNFAINIKELQKISTNHPITVNEYHAEYDRELEEWAKENLIYEDPEVSQYTDTCQTVPYLKGVIGSVTKDENGDCYKFSVTKEGTFVGMLYQDTNTDLQNTYFDLYDAVSNNRIAYSEISQEDMYQFIVTDLTPGDYILFISLPKGYTGDDVNYMMFINVK